MRLYGVAEQGIVETGFEPAIAGFDPAANPFSYSCLLLMPLRRQDTVFMHAGVEPAFPRLTAGCFPLKLTHRNGCCLCLSKARLQIRFQNVSIVAVRAFRRPISAMQA